MPRKGRVEYAGAIYHVMDRGNRQEAIYRSDSDRELFLRTLAEACAKTGWRVHSYVLMTNHYHILLETPEANLCAGMRWFQGTYTIRHNARHKLRGHLFQGRYKAILVDGEDGDYFRILSDYIHLNPIRAHLIPEEGLLESYPWSSFPSLLESADKRPHWLHGDWVLGSQAESDTEEERNIYRKAMEQRALEERNGKAIEEGLLKQLRRGWYFGSVKFRQKILDLLGSEEEQKEPGSAFRRSHDEREALHIMESGLREFQITREDLLKLPKGSILKIAIATVIKKWTLMSNEWIAQHLRMGVPSRVSRYCRISEQGETVKDLLEKLEMSIRKD